MCHLKIFLLFFKVMNVEVFAFSECFLFLATFDRQRSTPAHAEVTHQTVLERIQTQRNMIYPYTSNCVAGQHKASANHISIKIYLCIF